MTDSINQNDMKLSLKEVDELATLLKKHDLGEVSISSGDFSLTLKTKEEKAPIIMQGGVAAPAVQPVATPATPASPKKEVDGNVMKSPIVGTFYSSPAPDKPAFVTVGSTVKKGDVIFIIESMKLMNEIQSDFSGEVKEILSTDGQGVEFHQPIMIIK